MSATCRRSAERGSYLKDAEAQVERPQSLEAADALGDAAAEGVVAELDNGERCEGPQAFGDAALDAEVLQVQRGYVPLGRTRHPHDSLALPRPRPALELPVPASGAPQLLQHSYLTRLDGLA